MLAKLALTLLGDLQQLLKLLLVLCLACSQQIHLLLQLILFVKCAGKISGLRSCLV